MSPMCSSTSSAASQTPSTSTPVSWPMPGERRRERLGGDAVRRERDRVDRAADQVDAGAGRLERERERVAARRPGSRAPRAGRSARAAPRRARRRDAAGAARPDRRGRCARRRARASAARSRRARRGGSSRRGARRRTRGRRRRRPRRRPCRFPASFSGSWRRNESIPLSAALAMNRRTRSSPTGREPTRNRPRTASMSGVFVRALIARIRSHGLSTPRRTAASKRAAARDLEIGVSGRVQDLGQAQQLARRQRPGERLLREDADRGVDQSRHNAGP